MTNFTTSEHSETTAFYEGVTRGREQMARELAKKMIDGYILLLMALIAINVLPYFLF